MGNVNVNKKNKFRPVVGNLKISKNRLCRFESPMRLSKNKMAKKEPMESRMIEIEPSV
jgi:hypothetical protein